MKGVLQSRITSTEEGLEGLQAPREKLTPELHTTKTAIMNLRTICDENPARNCMSCLRPRLLLPCDLLLLNSFPHITLLEALLRHLLPKEGLHLTYRNFCSFMASFDITCTGTLVGPGTGLTVFGSTIDDHKCNLLNC